MNLIMILGLVAAGLTTFSALPQLIKSLKTKKTDDISLFMYITLSSGIVLWLVYGLLINNLPLILANSVSLVINAYVLLLKIKYG